MRTFNYEKSQYSVRGSLKPPDVRPETEDAMGDLALIRLLAAEPTLTDDEAARELGVVRPDADATERPFLLDYVESLRAGRG